MLSRRVCRGPRSVRIHAEVPPLRVAGMLTAFLLEVNPGFLEVVLGLRQLGHGRAGLRLRLLGVRRHALEALLLPLGAVKDLLDLNTRSLGFDLLHGPRNGPVLRLEQRRCRGRRAVMLPRVLELVPDPRVLVALRLRLLLFLVLLELRLE